MAAYEPLVSIVTPAYNAEPFLEECIESVLAQTYTNWEYVLVNNCSTDQTLAIAERYARQDPRIRVTSNRDFVGVIENHNNAFRSISPDSKYCKVVSADDWLFPECMKTLVDVAERHPSAAMVGCYALLGDRPICVGLPLRRSLFRGGDVCRLRLFGLDVLGAPTNLLYRASIVREGDAFFRSAAPNADQDACLRALQHGDYGFAHQILCFERIHERSVSSHVGKVNSFILDDLEFLNKYGPAYLTSSECARRRDEALSDYYRFLAVAAVNGYGAAFWRYHRQRLQEIGFKLRYGRLVLAIAGKVADLALNPKSTIETVLTRVVRRSQDCLTAEKARLVRDPVTPAKA